MTSGCITVPTAVAAIIETTGRDVEDWLTNLRAQEFQDEARNTLVEFVPHADLQRRSLDSSLIGAAHGLGRVLCTVCSESADDMQLSMTGGNFNLSTDVTLHGPPPEPEGRPSDEEHHGVVLITGLVLPDTVMRSAAGLPVDRIVRHPVLCAETISHIDRIDGDDQGRKALTRIWLQPSYRQVAIPAWMRKQIDDNRSKGGR